MVSTDTLFSNANWDPYPMANKLENFVIGLANMDVAVMLRIDRFSNPFFTVVKARDVLPRQPAISSGYTPVALQQEIQSLTNPVAPFGSCHRRDRRGSSGADSHQGAHARQAVATTMDLLGHDLLEASLWMDVRKAQKRRPQFRPGADPRMDSSTQRSFPLQADPNRTPAQSDAMLAASFVHTTDPAIFYSSELPRTGQDKTTGAGRCRGTP